MQANWTGQLLISESTRGTNRVAKTIDSLLVGFDGFFHTQIEIAENVQGTVVNITLSEAKVLYIKATAVSDSAPQRVIIELDGLSASVTTGEVKASEFLIFDTDIVALTIHNDGPAVLVEIAAGGDNT